MEERVHLRGGGGLFVADPPLEQGEEGAGEGVGGGAQIRRWKGDAGHGQSLLDGAGEVTDAEFADVGGLAGGDERVMEVADFGDVGEELVDWGDSLGRGAAPCEEGRQTFEEVFDVAEKEVLFVAEMGVEGGAADAGAIEELLDGDVVEGLLLDETDERVAEDVAGAADTRVRAIGPDWVGGSVRCRLELCVDGVRLRSRYGQLAVCGCAGFREALRCTES